MTIRKVPITVSFTLSEQERRHQDAEVQALTGTPEA